MGIRRGFRRGRSQDSDLIPRGVCLSPSNSCVWAKFARFHSFPQRSETDIYPEAICATGKTSPQWQYQSRESPSSASTERGGPRVRQKDRNPHEIKSGCTHWNNAKARREDRLDATKFHEFSQRAGWHF